MRRKHALLAGAWLDAISRARTGIPGVQRGPWSYIEPPSPLQPDGCSCGVFMLSAVEGIADGLAPSLTTTEWDVGSKLHELCRYRKRIAHAIAVFHAPRADDIDE